MRFIPIYIIFIPIITAMFIYVINKRFFNYVAFIAQLLVTFLSIRYYNVFNIASKKVILLLGGWDRNIGISLKNDNISFLFIFLTIFIWWMILLYSWDKRKKDFKFLFFLMFLEGTFLGLLQTNDIFNMFIFIEITTIVSTILIIYKKDGYSVRAGLYYLLFNSLGMIFYILGIMLIYVIVGSLNMEVITDKIAIIGDKSFVRLSYIFIMAAIGVKSAFFPVYNWLPKAHGAAPASISALLSGLLIKSGIYVFIRMNQIYQLNLLYDLFFILGFLTAISGIVFAISQKDIKQILAFHTISQIGIILMGLSSIGEKAYIGGIIHIFNHAVFKSLLFMGAGIIINVYGTRRITEVRGVFKSLPFVSIFMIIGMLSITGAPLFNGFVSKTIIKHGFKYNTVKTTMLYVINLGTSISFIKLAQIFFGKSNIKARKSFNDRLSMGILAITCILFGNLHIPIAKQLFDVDISYVNVFNFKVWINYVITISIGYIIYEWIIKKDYNIIKKLRHLKISFEMSCNMLVIFIFIMIIWSYFISQGVSI